MKKQDYIDKVSEISDKVCDNIDKMNDVQAQKLFDSIDCKDSDYHYSYMFNIKDYAREEASKHRSNTILRESLSDAINRYYFDMDPEYETVEDMKIHLKAIYKLYHQTQDILLLDIF